MVPLTVHVSGVTAFSPVGGHLYADVVINGVEQDTRSQSVSAGSVFVDWNFTQMVDDSHAANVTITLLNNLGGDPLFDQILDINPASGQQSVNLTVDPLTGFWTGDLAWPNNDAKGNGGADGTAGELFFGIRSNGIDSMKNSSGDGIPDLWKINGLDPDGNRSDATGVELPLNQWGANVNHKDLFLQLDWMPGAAPTREAINALKTAFAVAPITAGTNAAALPGGVDALPNPDGLPGINLHVDTGSLTDASGQLVGDNLGGGHQVPTANVSNLNAAFFAIKNGSGGSPANFNPARKWVFRYGISATRPTDLTGTSSGMNSGTTLNDTAQSWVPGEWGGYSVTITGGTGAGQPANPIVSNTANQLTVKNTWATTPDNTSTYSINWTSGGWGEIGGNDFIEYNHDAGTIMHEFGHTLNLRHGGFENTNGKPNYVSAMNYDDQFGIPQNNGGSIIDYSPAKISFLGSSTGGNTATTLNDTAQSWTANQWAGGYVELVVGNVRETRQVTSNTATQLVLAQAWSVVPPNTTPYDLYTASPTRAAAPLPAITESALDETTPLDPTDTANRMVFSQPNFSTTKKNVQYPLDGIDRDKDGGGPDGPDWNGDGKVNSGTVADNVNAKYEPTSPDISTAPYKGQDDWSEISLPFRQFSASANGDEIDDPLPTLEQELQEVADLHTTDLSLGVTTSASTVNQGEDHLVYTYTATNNGPNPADGVIVTDTLPYGVDFVSATTSQGTASFDGSTVTWRLGSVYPGVPITFHLEVIPQLVGPMTNTATATALGTDSDPTNNSAPATVTVLNVPPKITSVSLSATLIQESDQTSLTVNFTDPGRLDTHTATIDWGDGSIPQTVPITFPARTFTVAHQYLEENVPGTPDTITVTVADNNGGSDTATTPITVSDPAVLAQSSLDLNTKEGIAFALPVASFTDPGGAEPNSGDSDPNISDHYTASIDYGDGKPGSAGVITYAGDPDSKTGVFSVTAAHTFAEEGKFTVTVTINHEGIITTLPSSTATVRDNYGLLLLDPAGSPSLMVAGNGNVTVNNTGAVVVNSGSPSAYFLTGNAVVNATEADVGLGGGVVLGGKANLSLSEPEFNHEAPTSDSIALSLPPIPSTHFPAVAYSGSAPLPPLSPGTYDGGIFINGSGPVTLLPGVYYMNGGGFVVSGQGSVTGTGVLIVNAPLASTDVITLTGQARVNLTAPTGLTGALAPYNGITIMQAPASANPISVVSQGSLTMTGTLYAPAALLKINGTASVTVSAFFAGHLSQGGIVAVADAMVTVFGRLTINADPAPPFELATGLSAGLTADAGGLLTSRSGLRPGRLLVAVEDSQGTLTAAEQARIADAIRGLDAALQPFGVDLVEATGAEVADASIRLDIAGTTDFGGVAAGVLGVTENGDAITIVSGWNWYTGADPSAIGPGQYDFETVVAHELGHALGLGEGSDPSSVMYPDLASGVARRALSAGDLGIIDATEEGGRTAPADAGGGVAGPGPRAGAAPAESGARVGPDSATDGAAVAALTATGVGAAAEPVGTAEAAPVIVQAASASAVVVAPAPPAPAAGPAVTIWTAPANLDDLLPPADGPGAPPAAEPSPADGATPPDTGTNGTGADPAAPDEPAPALAPTDREAAALLLRSTDACFTAGVPVPVAPPALLAARSGTGSASLLAAAGLALGLGGWWTECGQEETRRRRPVLK
jgi:uncharacterized repeat protein (TIGR01451 family)